MRRWLKISEEPVLNKIMEKFDETLDRWIEMCVEDENELKKIKSERRCC